MTKGWRSLSFAVASALLMGACSSSSEGRTSIVDRPTTTPVIAWQPCGAIECGQLDIEVDSETPELGTVAVSLFRRVSTRDKNAPILILLGDRRFGYTPRDLAEKALLHFGTAVNGYTIVSVAARGMTDSSMPAGAEPRVGTLDVAEDLEIIREGLGVDDVYAMGWGSGATAITTWKMQFPESVKAAVIDSPMDPSKPMDAQILQQVESSQKAAVNAVKWCASHLSCVLNAEVADEISRFKLKMLTGTVPASVTKTLTARAAANALAANKPNDYFRAMADAMDGNAEAFLALAGPEPVINDAYAPCADVSQDVANRVSLEAAKAHAQKNRQFPVGTEPTIYALCAQLPPTPRPLGAVQFFDDAKGDKILVTISRGDPIVPPAPARKMAASMEWTYKSVYGNQHLVVGYDRAITDAAMEFLAS